ncbi:hypothetical protein MHLP_00280 [Candidatus Mycoplasma haematolamae str. Purdue]|uniref:HD domain-containing protein n=1 Tax=Mycoplasma haematolamae (strain Purdue) TaxID=1212765 RepID=I7CEH3_MYCHA|nr:HDIG domain-containing metalloprotein [Candidatus Mycoplasma haematolamae]AFO51636.1 hypothetical protein MHLP_00280 [Candidatus Mycoplasma haematolamae str. Purdue]
MIHYLSKYKSPRLFNGCYVEFNLVEGKFFSEKTIGQLVGKSGERKEEFFSLTGVKPHIEYSNDKPILILSKYNVREITLASLLGQRFKSTKSWSSCSINKHFWQLSEQLVREETEIGERALAKLEHEPARPSSSSLSSLVGRMSNEQYSTNQTLLEHSIEVSEEAEKAAISLGLDPVRSKKVAFFHDIGKIFLPYYLHSSEKALEQLKEITDEEIRECISTHHNPLGSFTSPYIALTALINRVLSQTHFISHCESSESLKKTFQSFLYIKKEEGLLSPFYILSSGYHFWFIFNSEDKREKNLIEGDWVTELKKLVEEHTKTLDDDSHEIKNLSFSITLYWLPTKDEAATFERLKLFKSDSDYDN